MDASAIIVIGVAYTIGCGALAGYIAAYRRGNGIPYFFLGVALGLLGVAVALLVPFKPRTPRGWRGVRCPRCSAEQNVQPGQQGFECWRCGDEFPLEWD